MPVLAGVLGAGVGALIRPAVRGAAEDRPSVPVVRARLAAHDRGSPPPTLPSLDHASEPSELQPDLQIKADHAAELRAEDARDAAIIALVLKRVDLAPVEAEKIHGRVTAFFEARRRLVESLDPGDPGDGARIGRGMEHLLENLVHDVRDDLGPARLAQLEKAARAVLHGTGVTLTSE